MTTRRYLHGPLSERILTIWREGKLLFGEVSHSHDWKIPYENQLAHGVWLVHGDGLRPLDFRKADNRTPDNGTPIHALLWRDGDLALELEACAPFARKPTLHGRLTVSNASASLTPADFAFLLRTGPEKSLLFGVPDIYKPYAPELRQWTNIPSTWQNTGDGIFTDGDFRRLMATSSDSNRLLSTAVGRVMTRRPAFIRDDAYAADLLKVYERRHIDDLPVINRAGTVVGVVDIQDLPKMKVM